MCTPSQIVQGHCIVDRIRLIAKSNHIKSWTYPMRSDGVYTLQPSIMELKYEYYKMELKYEYYKMELKYKICKNK